MDGDSTKEIGQDSFSMFINGEEEVALGGEGNSRDIGAMGKRKGI